MLAIERSVPGKDYFQWSGYITKRQEKNNMLRRTILSKWRAFNALVLISVTIGIVFPALTRNITFTFDGWLSFLSMEYLYLAALILIVLPCFWWVRGILFAISNFENVKKPEEVETTGQELWKARLGVLYTGKTIPHDKEGWAWEPRRQGVFIMKDKHCRRIEVPGISRSVTLEQDLEYMGVKGDVNWGWRLITVSLAGPYDERTAHIGGFRGRMHVNGDDFQTKEELLDIADEQMEWAISEWQRLDREGKLD